MKRNAIYFALLTVLAATLLGCGGGHKAPAQDDPALIMSDSAAKLFNTSGDLNIALALLDSARLLNSALPIVHLNRFKVLNKLGRYSEAIEALQEWGEVQPNNPGPRLYLGVMHEISGNDSMAQVAYAESLALNRLVLKSYVTPSQKRTTTLVSMAICSYLTKDSITMHSMIDSIKVVAPSNAIANDLLVLPRAEVLKRVL